MPPTPHTPNANHKDMQLRAEVGDGLVESITRMVDAGQTYREIAWWLKDATGVQVSHETVRSWHIEWKHEAQGAA